MSTPETPSGESVTNLTEELNAITEHHCFMITTDLQAVSRLPLHTRMETAVGLGFDVLNGRRGDLEIEPDMSLKDIKLFDVMGDGHRVFKAISCETAKEVREAVELLFGSSVFQRGYSKLRIVKGVRGRISVMNVSR